MKKYFQATWNSRDVQVITLITLSLILVVILLSAFWAMGYIPEPPYYGLIKNNIFYKLGLMLLQEIILLAPLSIYTWRKHGFKLAHFGFQKVGFFRTIFSVAGGYIAYLGITALITAFIIFTNIKIPGYQIQESIFKIFGDKNLELIITGIIVVGIAPFVEEIFFRGFFLRFFVDKTGTFYGSIISALIFALFHMQWQSIIPIFILGLILNYLVIRHKSIVPAIIFHVINNGIAFTLQILILKDIIQIDSII